MSATVPLTTEQFQARARALIAVVLASSDPDTLGLTNHPPNSVTGWTSANAEREARRLMDSIAAYGWTDVPALTAYDLCHTLATYGRAW